MDHIVSAALAARTVTDVDSLEKLLRTALGEHPVRYLGDQEANWSSISSPADATSVLFERATNMFDAIIEFEAERRAEVGCRSPKAAAHWFFGVPMEGVGDMTPTAREAMSELALVMLLDSDNSTKRPTIAFRDKGIGLRPAEVPNTILSLQKSNKLRKAYTHGIFGKGGSSACAFSSATIVVTRKQPELLSVGEEDRISVAGVREDEADDMGLPFYRYLVGADELPYSVPAAAHPEFEPGTYVAHINYQANKMGLQNWNQEESIYAFAETILFQPTMPYLLHDARTGNANMRPAERRKPSVVSGLGQRLDGLKSNDGTILARSTWQTVVVPDVGEVRLRWLLFEDRDKRRTRVAKGFVTIFTTNGQIHHAWDDARFQQAVDGRRRVGQRLFVQVDCDAIELRKRSKVFDSFRAQVRRSPEGLALEDAVADALANDADLDDFESTFVRQSLASGAESVSSSFRKRLNKALRSKIPGMAPTVGKGKGRKPPKAKRPEDLYAEPTTMTGPEEITLLIGGRATAYMEINANDAFVPDIGEMSIEGRTALMPSLSVGDLRKGRLRLTFTAPPAMGEGVDEVDVVLSWMRKNGGLGRMVWPIRINAVSKIQPKPAGQPKGGTGVTKDSGDVALIWTSGADQGWPDSLVGELQYLKGDDLAAQPGDTYQDLTGVEELIPTIVLNRNFVAWAEYLRTIAKGASDEMLNTRRDRYGLAVGITVANMTLEERKIAKKRTAYEAKPNGTEEPPKSMSDDQMRRALAEAARGVVALMPDFDQLLGDLDR